VPSWLDTYMLRLIAAFVLVAIGVAGLLVVRFLKIAILRGLLLVLLLAGAVGIWLLRTDMETCTNTCSCAVGGRSVVVASSDNPSCRN